MNTLRINDRIPFTVKLVRKGERYGLKKCIVHLEDDPLVEFYDARQDPAKFDPEGQFISRYNLRTLVASDRELRSKGLSNGLCLYGGVNEWTVENMRPVMDWLYSITNPEDPLNVLRDIAAHLIEARNLSGPMHERLAMIDGGIADELLNRANKILGGTLPPWI